MKNVEDIHKLREIFNDHIYSIIKYGFGKRNLLVVLKEMDISYMMKIRPYIQKIRRQKNILILTKENVSKKTIGVDFLNIKLTSVVIYGQDIFKSASIDTSKIKRQIKYEANRILVSIRNEILDTTWRKSMKDLLYTVVPRVLPLIVAHLYVLGEKIPNAIPDTINRYIKNNEQAYVLLKIRRDIKPKEVEVLFDEILKFLEGLVDL